MDAKEVNNIFDTAIMGQAFSDYDHYRDLIKARAAVAEAYDRLAALERECEGLRADAERWSLARSHWHNLCTATEVSNGVYRVAELVIGVGEHEPFEPGSLDAAIDALRLTSTGEGS